MECSIVKKYKKKLVKEKKRKKWCTNPRVPHSVAEKTDT